jgi:hypothetical protein
MILVRATTILLTSFSLLFFSVETRASKNMPYYKVNDYRSVGQTKWEKSQKEAQNTVFKQQQQQKGNHTNKTKEASLDGGKHRPAPSPGTTNVSMKHRSGKMEHC